MKKVSIVPVIALALTLGVAGIASAQGGGRPDGQRAAQQDSTHRRGFGRRGGPDAILLRGITLSASQKTRVEALRDSARKQMEANRPKGQIARGDTTGMGARRAQMQQFREKRIAELRQILTSDQRVQFYKNVAELKARMAEHRGGKAWGKGRAGLSS